MRQNFKQHLLIIEQGRSQEISSKYDNSPTNQETEKQIVLPNVVYSKLELAFGPHKSKQFLERKRKMDKIDWDLDEHWDVEQKYLYDLPLLPITIKRILCEHDCSMVPITNNQLGVSREIDSLKAFWRLERDPPSPPQPASPEADVTQDKDIEVDEELIVPTTLVTPQGNRFIVLEAPPPPVKNEKTTFSKSQPDKSNYSKALIKV